MSMTGCVRTDDVAVCSRISLERSCTVLCDLLDPFRDTVEELSLISLHKQQSRSICDVQHYRMITVVNEQKSIHAKRRY